YLSNFVRLTRAQHRAVGIIPQYFHPENNPDKLFTKGVEEHNQVNQEVAADLGAPFAGAVTEGMTIKQEDTYDNYHFNRDCGHKMARSVFDFMLSAVLLPETCNGDSAADGGRM